MFNMNVGVVKQRGIGNRGMCWGKNWKYSYIEFKERLRAQEKSYKNCIEFEMNHYNNMCQEGAVKQSPAQPIGSFEKSVMSNSKQSIEKHLSHMKIDQNQLNYAIFLSIEHFRLDLHTDECLLLLLRHKANPNCELNKQTPLTAACRKGQHLLVKVLLENGAKIEFSEKVDQHPLLVVLADRRENYDVAQTLINYMPNVNAELGTRPAIVIAVEREFLRIFKILVEKDAILKFDSENILHIIVKKKFTRLEKKKKFIKELAGKMFLMNEDSNHKLPTDYEQNEEIRTFILDNFKPKVQKVEIVKLQPFRQLKEKQSKSKDSEQLSILKQSKKKGKELDASFSEADEEEFQEDKAEPTVSALEEVMQKPEEENNKETKEGGKIVESQKQQQKDKPLENIEIQMLQKQREEQKQKIRKKLNVSLGIQTKKKSGNNQQPNEIGIVGTKKKKPKAQQIVPKTLLKRKNSSMEQENKLEKSKASTVKKTNNNSKKQVTEFEKCDKFGIQDEKIGSMKKSKQEQMWSQIQQEKLEKESETDSEEAYMGSVTSLNEEILDLTNKIIMKNQEKITMIQHIVKHLEDTIRETLIKHTQNPRLELYVYGSQATGLAIEHSDVDLLAVADLEPLNFLQLLQTSQSFTTEQIQDCKFISGATVPVIKLTMSQKYSFMHVDLTFHNKNHMGVKCCEMIKSFMQSEVLLRPLVLVIKMLVDAYDLSDPYKGGLSSYAITLMVIAMLQFTEKHKKRIENVGEMLLNFLYFYGEQIDYVSQAIIIHALGIFGQQPVFCIYRLPYITDLKPKLIIYDPLNPVNNVGRTTFRIVALKKLFSCCYMRLKSDERCQLTDLFDGAYSELLI